MCKSLLTWINIWEYFLSNEVLFKINELNEFPLLLAIISLLSALRHPSSGSFLGCCFGGKNECCRTSVPLDSLLKLSGNTLILSVRLLLMDYLPCREIQRPGFFLLSSVSTTLDTTLDLEGSPPFNLTELVSMPQTLKLLRLVSYYSCLSNLRKWENMESVECQTSNSRKSKTLIMWGNLFRMVIS